MELKMLMQNTFWIIIDGLAAVWVIVMLLDITKQEALGQTLLLLGETLCG